MYRKRGEVNPFYRQGIDWLALVGRGMDSSRRQVPWLSSAETVWKRKILFSWGTGWVKLASGRNCDQSNGNKLPAGTHSDSVSTGAHAASLGIANSRRTRMRRGRKRETNRWTGGKERKEREEEENNVRGWSTVQSPSSLLSHKE